MGITHAFVSPQAASASTSDVDGPIWNADHLHVPFVVEHYRQAANSGFALSSTATVGVEMWSTSKLTRCVIDLSKATQARFQVTLIGLGTAGAAIGLGYKTTNDTSSGSWIAGGPAVAVSANANTIIDSGWVTLAAGARIDNCYIAAICTGAWTTTPATVGNIRSLFR